MTPKKKSGLPQSVGEGATPSMSKKSIGEDDEEHDEFDEDFDEDDFGDEGEWIWKLMGVVSKSVGWSMVNFGQ